MICWFYLSNILIEYIVSNPLTGSYFIVTNFTGINHFSVSFKSPLIDW